MLASLRRNGLVDSLAVTRHHHATTSRCHSRHIALLARTADGPCWKSSSAFVLHPPAIRFVSTTPPPTTDAPAKEIPAAASATPTRKHKVDLRPGPIKSQKSSSESVPAPASSATPNPAPEHSPASSQTSTESPTLAHLPNPAHVVIETAKEDAQEAYKHGILAPPPPDASWAGKLFHQAKEYFKFYWNGVKLINTHRIRVRAIEERVKAGGAPLSRWEARFIANYKRDLLKLIPFALIVIIAEEAIPLVVIYTPFLLPSTCLLPSQKERIDAKRREKQRTFANSMKPVFQNVHTFSSANPDAHVKQLLDNTALLAYTGVLSLSTLGPSPLRLRRVKKHLKALAADDVLLARENLGQILSADELREALEERGIVTEGLSTDAMRARLNWWLSQTGDADSDPVRTRVQLVARNVVGQHDAAPRA
ncbi:hypothetical protein BD413DRAFT_555338 [Trametes elegans]|nr:hypothetical protein BD413DRAFT_555338 [Trametes elegans]